MSTVWNLWPPHTLTAAWWLRSTCQCKPPAPGCVTHPLSFKATPRQGGGHWRSHGSQPLLLPLGTVLLAGSIRGTRLLADCIFLSAGAEGLAVPSGGAQLNAGPTDCQIFTLTPPPATRSLVTRPQPVTRTSRSPLLFFPQWPRVPPRFPGRPFLPPDCNRHFLGQPWFWPRRCLAPGRYFWGTQLSEESSSEETEERKSLSLRSRRRPGL
ncbi:odontogenesis associated phosphoprotein isoform X1 [Cavia porcellus]|uniref:odontogenesis associated phosphoprotein isoform X1 n=1 Tax=Cavia porcellus TaxID=10141 RepID=UPI002FE1C737